MRRKILLIEDEADIAELVRLVLETQDYEVKAVLDSTRAYEEAREYRPDAMLVDLRMPRMDGWTVFKTLRADKTFDGMPIAILTAKAEEFDAMVGLHVMKADSYITKPFGKQELINRVNGLFEKEPNRRVLALDDEVDVLEFLRLLLESLGWEVTTASTPEEAFERLSGHAHFLVMTDIAMPRMDGYEFMSAVQSRGIPSRMAFMTGFGYDPNHTLVKIRRDHHYPVLFKPFSREKVSQAVQSAYEAYHAGLVQG